MISALLHRIETSDALDGVIEPTRDAVRPLLDGGRTRYVLSGAWMGHALHPLLTDVVIGTWGSAAILDAIAGPAARPAARQLIATGIAASAPTAAAGLHDWLDLGKKVRRAGFVHGVANVVALGLQVASWTARRNGHHGRGVALSTAALGALGVGGYIGGHLTYVLGSAVANTAFQDTPGEWTRTVRREDLAGGPQSVDVDGTPVLLVDDGGVLHAMADTCSHAGCSLSSGSVGGGSVTCPCHGSRFSLSDGSVQAGPAATSQPTLEVRVVDGHVEVREPR